MSDRNSDNPLYRYQVDDTADPADLMDWLYRHVGYPMWGRDDTGNDWLLQQSIRPYPMDDGYVVGIRDRRMAQLFKLSWARDTSFPLISKMVGG